MVHRISPYETYVRFMLLEQESHTDNIDLLALSPRPSVPPPEMDLRFRDLYLVLSLYNMLIALTKCFLICAFLL